MTKKRKPGKLARALLEPARDMREAGLLDKATHEKITLRHLGPGAVTSSEFQRSMTHDPGA